MTDHGLGIPARTFSEEYKEVKDLFEIDMILNANNVGELAKMVIGELEKNMR
jgi:hypothetical protein